MTVLGIYGASGFGKEVASLARHALGSEARIVFIDDAFEGAHLNGASVMNFEEFLALDEKKRVTVAIANSQIRHNISEKCKSAGLTFQSLSSPNAVFGDDCQIGEGAIFCSFTHCTASVKIGQSFHCNIYSYVAHDCVIGDYVTFAPSVNCNGNIVIEDHAYIGTGAVLKQGAPGKPLVIGKGAVVGMGAVVLKDVPAGAVVIGNPARALDRS